MTQARAALTPCCGADWTMTDVQLDEPRGDEILVRIVATGICHTDISVRDQHLPTPLSAVLGHEGAGVVERVGPAVTELVPGDHVVLTVINCGKCNNCLGGSPTYCEQMMQLNFSGRRLDGSALIRRGEEEVSGGFFGQSSFATFALATERNAVKVPKDIDLSLLGPLGCGIQTGAGTVFNTLRPEIGSSIVIFGAGAVGLSAIMAARVAGCTSIIAVDLHANRLELARELGATHVIDPLAGDIVQAVRAIGGGVNYAIDTTANTTVIRQAVDCLLPMGRCTMVGVSPPGAEVTVPVMSLFFGQTLCGAVEGNAVPKILIPRLIELWRQGRFPFERMVKFYDFEQINQAVADSASGATLKAILRIGTTQA